MLTPVTALIASILVAVVGLLIFWSNPVRSVNRAVGFCSLNIAVWLACWHLTATFARIGNGLFWYKLTCTIGALAPISFGLVKESIVVSTNISVGKWIGRNIAWLIGPLLIAALPFTDYFIPPSSTDAQRQYGWGYHAYFWALPGLYGFLLFDSLGNLRKLSGGRRLEIQVWLLGGCVLAGAIYALIGLSALTHDPLYRRLQPLAVLLFYAATAYAITTHRIFDARQILLVGLEKGLLVVSVSAVAFGLERLFTFVLAEPFALVATTGFTLWFAAVLNARLDRIFDFYPQATAVRQAVFSAAKKESRVDALEASFLSILKGWGQSDHAVILSGGHDSLRGNGLELPGECEQIAVLRQLRWVTPERLMREKATPKRAMVDRFLKDNRLGAVVLSNGPSLTVVVGVGVAVSRRPFTYPQMTQLMEVASIMESALERAHFSAKAQHAEQLATVGLLGASLAHEIRNPLVTIKTFVQLLPKHHQDPIFRQKFFKLIGDEVSRIDQLTEQLLDLASPRTYVAEMVELHPVLRASLDLVAAKASDKKIQFLTELHAQPDIAFTDASAAKQVMLNLCFNAIQAVEAHKDAAERWVRIVTRNVASGIEMVVADSGPGIAAEIRPRLFQPFQTTKSSGFGLGLAICSDILANLNATISVDPSELGRGATFRVIFPCQPSSS